MEEKKRIEQRKARAIQVKKQLITLFSGLLLCSIVISVALTLMIKDSLDKRAYADAGSLSKEKYYTSYIVRANDTLESIAEDNRGDDTVEDYIRSIRFTNHLYEDEEILPGTALIIYYYK